MDQHIAAIAHARDGRGGRSIAADHHRSPLVVEAIAQRRLDRIVLHREGLHLDAHPSRRCVWASALSGDGECARACTAARHDVCAVMRDAIAIIGSVGGIEAADDLVDAFGAIDGHRRWSARSPPSAASAPRPAHRCDRNENASGRSRRSFASGTPICPILRPAPEPASTRNTCLPAITRAQGPDRSGSGRGEPVPHRMTCRPSSRPAGHVGAVTRPSPRDHRRSHPTDRARSTARRQCPPINTAISSTRRIGHPLDVMS